MSTKTYQCGLTNSAAGGTRNTVYTSRDWQVPMRFDTANCPFCAQSQLNEQQYEFGGVGIRRFDNIATPYPFHNLVIPAECYGAEKLWQLGGKETWAATLACVAQIVAERESELQIFCHVGYTAGQRIGHQHTHVLEPIMPPAVAEEIAEYYRNGENGTTPLRRNELAILAALDDPSVLFREHNGFRIGAAGPRAGQLIIAPPANFRLTEETVKPVAAVMTELVELCNKAFRSDQGLPPDFSIGIHGQPDGTISFGTYIPILNYQGWTEAVAQLLGTCQVMPWTHQTTVVHLRSF